VDYFVTRESSYKEVHQIRVYKIQLIAHVCVILFAANCHFIINVSSLQGSVEHTLLCYWLKIICLCTDSHLTCIQYLQSGLLEVAQQFTICDGTLRLISKALVGHIATQSTDKLDDIISLTDEDMTLLIATFQAGLTPPLTSHTIASILKGLMSTEVNIEKFRQHKLTSLLRQKLSIPIMDQIIAQLEGTSIVDVTLQASDNKQTATCDSGMIPLYIMHIKYVRK